VTRFYYSCAHEQFPPGDQTGFSWAPSNDAALEAARVWKGAGPPEYYVEDWHDPLAMYEHAEKTIDDDAFRELQILSADPDVHLERIRAVEKLGSTIVVLMNISGADPLAAIDVYAERVLPALRSRARESRRGRAVPPAVSHSHGQ
jgi:coenzyme F420-dependent glucose-6-phosphate dehydrogenase